jgi:hypothetical protein
MPNRVSNHEVIGQALPEEWTAEPQWELVPLWRRAEAVELKDGAIIQNA